MPVIVHDRVSAGAPWPAPVALSPTLDCLATVSGGAGGSPATLFVVRWLTWQRVLGLALPESSDALGAPVSALVWSPDGKHLALLARSGVLMLVHIETRSLWHLTAPSPPRPIKDVLMSNAGAADAFPRRPRMAARYERALITGQALLAASIAAAPGGSRRAFVWHFAIAPQLSDGNYGDATAIPATNAGASAAIEAASAQGSVWLGTGLSFPAAACVVPEQARAANEHAANEFTPSATALTPSRASAAALRMLAHILPPAPLPPAPASQDGDSLAVLTPEERALFWPVYGAPPPELMPSQGVGSAAALRAALLVSRGLTTEPAFGPLFSVWDRARFGALASATTSSTHTHAGVAAVAAALSGGAASLTSGGVAASRASLQRRVLRLRVGVSVPPPPAPAGATDDAAACMLHLPAVSSLMLTLHSQRTLLDGSLPLAVPALTAAAAAASAAVGSSLGGRALAGGSLGADGNTAAAFAAGEGSEGAPPAFTIAFAFSSQQGADLAAAAHIASRLAFADACVKHVLRATALLRREWHALTATLSRPLGSLQRALLVQAAEPVEQLEHAKAWYPCATAPLALAELHRLACAGTLTPAVSEWLEGAGTGRAAADAGVGGLRGLASLTASVDAASIAAEALLVTHIARSGEAALITAVALREEARSRESRLSGGAGGSDVGRTKVASLDALATELSHLLSLASVARAAASHARATHGALLAWLRATLLHWDGARAAAEARRKGAEAAAVRRATAAAGISGNALSSKARAADAAALALELAARSPPPRSPPPVASDMALVEAVLAPAATPAAATVGAHIARSPSVDSLVPSASQKLQAHGWPPRVPCALTQLEDAFELVSAAAAESRGGGGGDGAAAPGSPSAPALAEDDPLGLGNLWGDIGDNEAATVAHGGQGTELPASPPASSGQTAHASQVSDSPSPQLKRAATVAAPTAAPFHDPLLPYSVSALIDDSAMLLRDSAIGGDSEGSSPTLERLMLTTASALTPSRLAVACAPLSALSDDDVAAAANASLAPPVLARTLAAQAAAVCARVRSIYAATLLAPAAHPASLTCAATFSLPMPAQWSTLHAQSTAAHMRAASAVWLDDCSSSELGGSAWPASGAHVAAVYLPPHAVTALRLRASPPASGATPAIAGCSAMLLVRMPVDAAASAVAAGGSQLAAAASVVVFPAGVDVLSSAAYVPLPASRDASSALAVSTAEERILPTSAAGAGRHALVTLLRRTCSVGDGESRARVPLPSAMAAPPPPRGAAHFIARLPYRELHWSALEIGAGSGSADTVSRMLAAMDAEVGGGVCMDNAEFDDGAGACALARVPGLFVLPLPAQSEASAPAFGGNNGSNGAAASAADAESSSEVALRRLGLAPGARPVSLASPASGDTMTDKLLAPLLADALRPVELACCAAPAVVLEACAARGVVTVAFAASGAARRSRLLVVDMEDGGDEDVGNEEDGSDGREED